MSLIASGVRILESRRGCGPLTLERSSDADASRFKSLADTWADAATPHGRLMLAVLAGLAEFGRELRSRTSEGCKRAACPWDRPLKLTKHQQQEARKRYERGGTLVEIAKTYDGAHTTISRLIAR
jgi:DNA invertase Pin-like site-specific DNA recombinase